MVKARKPQHIQAVTIPLSIFPAFIPPAPARQNPVIPACHIRPNDLCVNDQVAAAKGHSHAMTLYIFLPQDIVGPEKAPKEGMSHAYVLGAEIPEQVFIGATWLPADLR